MNQSGSAGCCPGLGCSCRALASPGIRETPLNTLQTSLIDEDKACRPLFQYFFSLLFSPLIFCHWGSSIWLLGQGCLANVCFPASILNRKTPLTCTNAHAHGKEHFASRYLVVVVCQGKILDGNWHFNASAAFICAGPLQCYLYKTECL